MKRFIITTVNGLPTYFGFFVFCFFFVLTANAYIESANGFFRNTAFVFTQAICSDNSALFS